MPADAPPLIRAVGLDLSFAGRQVLSGVDAAIQPGEIVTLIGPNGAGKTTLLRVMLGLVQPDRGTVERRTGLRVGYMPQRFAVDDLLPLRVRRFLELGRPAAGQDPAAALAEVKAAHVIDAPVQAISGGELRRVLLARALLRDPGLLVLDEPAQGVDVVGQSELFRLIVALRERRRCGILMVSHDLHLVMAATDTVICLNAHVCCTGRPDAVSRHPEYLALFGHPAEELAPYAHRHDHVHDESGRIVHRHDGTSGSSDRAGHRHG
jgi:zinc transport system ATP-binding protein